MENDLFTISLLILHAAIGACSFGFSRAHKNRFNNLSRLSPSLCTWTNTLTRRKSDKTNILRLN